MNFPNFDIYKMVTIAGTGLGMYVIAKDQKMSADKKLKLMGVTAAIGGGAYLGRHFYQEWQEKKDLEQHIEGGYNLSMIATEIYDAFWNNDVFGITECEQCAINALKQVPKEYINSLALVYYNMYGENLRENFKFYLTNEEYDQVKPLLQ